MTVRVKVIVDPHGNEGASVNVNGAKLFPVPVRLGRFGYGDAAGCVMVTPAVEVASSPMIAVASRTPVFLS